MSVMTAAPAVAGDTAQPPAALEAGARYGQAMGAAEICIGSKLTPKAEAMRQAYSGADLESFKAQAGKVYAMWLQVKNCARPDDPNQCKIIMDKSCAAAWAEIGDNGSAMPGLMAWPNLAR